MKKVLVDRTNERALVDRTKEEVLVERTKEEVLVDRTAEIVPMDRSIENLCVCAHGSAERRKRTIVATHITLDIP